MRTLLLVLTLTVITASSACSGSSTPTPGSNPTPTPSTGECASADDCVVSCAVPEQCCDAQLCEPCQQAYSRDELAEIEAWRGQSCEGESCPMAKCMAPTEQAVAVCNAGQCEVQMAPIPRD